MFYYLYLKFYSHLHVLNLFRYITFRTAYSSLTALLLSLLLGPWLIEKLKQFQIGQYIREEGPSSHRAKAGTPTMGGVLIDLCIIVPTLLWADLSNIFVWLALGVTVAFGAIGFWDDYLKLRRKHNLGLRARSKLTLQVLVAVLLAAALGVLSERGLYSTRLTFPFFKNLHPDFLIHAFLHHGWVYPLAFLPFVGLVILVVVGSSNAVNLTDVAGNLVWATYLDLEHLPKSGELTIFAGPWWVRAWVFSGTTPIRRRSSWGMSVRFHSARPLLPWLSSSNRNSCCRFSGGSSWWRPSR